MVQAYGQKLAIYSQELCMICRKKVEGEKPDKTKEVWGEIRTLQ